MKIYKISVVRHSADWRIVDHETVAYCTEEVVEKVKQAYKEMYQVDDYRTTYAVDENNDILFYVDTINVVTK